MFLFTLPCTCHPVLFCFFKKRGGVSSLFINGGRAAIPMGVTRWRFSDFVNQWIENAGNEETARASDGLDPRRNQTARAPHTKFEFLISYNDKNCFLPLSTCSEFEGELDLSRRGVTLRTAGATETKRSCQQTNHLGCCSNNNSRRTCAATRKVCLQPRLFIHFV